MRHELAPKELMYLQAHRASRLCPWCLRKLAEAKYSRLLPSQVKASGKFVEEPGICAECGRHMNVFVIACPFCGQAAPQEHHAFECSMQAMKEAPRKIASEMQVSLEKADLNTEHDEEDPGPPPPQIVRGGLPSLGKRR